MSLLPEKISSALALAIGMAITPAQAFAQEDTKLVYDDVCVDVKSSTLKQPCADYRTLRKRIIEKLGQRDFDGPRLAELFNTYSNSSNFGGFVYNVENNNRDQLPASASRAKRSMQSLGEILKYGEKEQFGSNIDAALNAATPASQAKPRKATAGSGETSGEICLKYDPSDKTAIQFPCPK